MCLLIFFEILFEHSRGQLALTFCMMLLVQEKATRTARLDIDQLVRDHYNQVFQFCSLRVGYHHAGDAAQESFLIAQRSLSKFRGESKPLTWLLGIAHNECRRMNRVAKREEPLPEFQSTGSSEANLVDRQVLCLALAGLSVEHREVVVMHEMDGLTYEEIATILSVPVGTVKSRLYHAFLNLRKCLQTSMEVQS